MQAAPVAPLLHQRLLAHARQMLGQGRRAQPQALRQIAGTGLAGFQQSAQDQQTLRIAQRAQHARSVFGALGSERGFVKHI